VPPVLPIAEQNEVSPRFFSTFGIPVLAGRDFAPADREGSPTVVVVNEELARRSWPGQSALGRRVKLVGPPDVMATVVGVAGGIRQRALGDPPAPQIYQPLSQAVAWYNSVAVRTAGDPSRLGRAVREAIWSVDRDQPVWRVRPMAAALAAQSAQPRFALTLAAAFALLALLLACVGVYGVMAQVLTERTREMGIRMALGADPGRIFRLALGRGARVVLAACGVGLAAAAGATRLLESQLFGVGAADPITLAAVAAILSAVALAACALPARRAARVDPMVSLRRI
jgi:predicted permease